MKAIRKVEKFLREEKTFIDPIYTIKYISSFQNTIIINFHKTPNAYLVNR